MPFNALKASEHGSDNGHAPQQGAHGAELPPASVSASTVSEDNVNAKVGGPPEPGHNPGNGPLTRVRTDSQGRAITTNHGVMVADNQNSLKASLRGPTLLEDFILREKITHFDHERIPERVVHARGSGAHGVFEAYDSLADITQAGLFAAAGKQTPVFVRFSTVAGERGSADTVRDTRGFAVKFYTDEGNWDLVGNNIPVFFIQDSMKFPDVVHAVKPEPHHGMPQASSAHDTFWDFISLMPESIHHTLWVMSDRGIPRSYRTMQGFGVNTYRLVNAEGVARFVKFHWLPLAGTHSLVWDEAAKITGADPDFHRRDLWESIEAGNYPAYELALQVFSEEQAESFSFDVLDATKLIPEELVPLRAVGKLKLNRNPDNFFAETEQVAFCVAHLVPGIDFSNDPLLHGRIHSYQDTQLSRLGGPNFHEIPVNASIAQVHNNQRDGVHRQAIHRGRVSYEPNSLAGGCPFQAGASRGFVSARTPAPVVPEDKVRGKPEKFADHYSQAQLFFNSQSVAEKRHIANAFRFELSRVTLPAIRERVVSILVNVDMALAQTVADGLGMAVPQAQPKVLETPVSPEVAASPALSLMARPGAQPAAGRKVALLVAEGADGDSLRLVHQRLLAAHAVPRIVGLRLGSVTLGDGSTVVVETTVEATPSVLWDALVLPSGGAADGVAQGKAAGGQAGNGLPALMAARAEVLDFIKEQYRHGKPILAHSEGAQQVLSAAGIPLQLSGDRPDPGLILGRAEGKDGGGNVLAEFIAALGRPRAFERELAAAFV
ncbi:MAG: catalase [Rubrivivax sp.]|nr:catalase [Rubrivivax sp.]